MGIRSLTALIMWELWELQFTYYVNLSHSSPTRRSEHVLSQKDLLCEE